MWSHGTTSSCWVTCRKRPVQTVPPSPMIPIPESPSRPAVPLPTRCSMVRHRNYLDCTATNIDIFQTRWPSCRVDPRSSCWRRALPGRRTSASSSETQRVTWTSPLRASQSQFSGRRVWPTWTRRIRTTMASRTRIWSCGCAPPLCPASGSYIAVSTKRTPTMPTAWSLAIIRLTLSIVSTNGWDIANAVSNVFVFCPSDYPVVSFDGTKRMILSTTSVLGGKNPFLGIAYIVVGAICITLGLALLFIHMRCSRRWVDHRTSLIHPHCTDRHSSCPYPPLPQHYSSLSLLRVEYFIPHWSRIVSHGQISVLLGAR